MKEGNNINQVPSAEEVKKSVLEQQEKEVSVEEIIKWAIDNTSEPEDWYEDKDGDWKEFLKNAIVKISNNEDTFDRAYTEANDRAQQYVEIQLPYNRHAGGKTSLDTTEMGVRYARVKIDFPHGWNVVSALPHGWEHLEAIRKARKDPESSDNSTKVFY